MRFVCEEISFFLNLKSQFSVPSFSPSACQCVPHTCTQLHPPIPSHICTRTNTQANKVSGCVCVCACPYGHVYFFAPPQKPRAGGLNRCSDIKSPCDMNFSHTVTPVNSRIDNNCYLLFTAEGAAVGATCLYSNNE